MGLFDWLFGSSKKLKVTNDVVAQAIFSASYERINNSLSSVSNISEIIAESEEGYASIHDIDINQVVRVDKKLVQQIDVDQQMINNIEQQIDQYLKNQSGGLFSLDFLESRNTDAYNKVHSLISTNITDSLFNKIMNDISNSSKIIAKGKEYAEIFFIDVTQLNESILTELQTSQEVTNITQGINNVIDENYEQKSEGGLFSSTNIFIIAVVVVVLFIFLRK